MDLVEASSGLVSLYAQIIGTLTFCFVFLFLWRRSGIIYFGLWSIAWVVDTTALIFGYCYYSFQTLPWLVSYTLFDFAFAVVLFSAARVGFATHGHDWRPALKILLGYPIFFILAYLLESRGQAGHYPLLHALMLAFVYFSNWNTIKGNRGLGEKLFRFSLLCLALAFLFSAMVLFASYSIGVAPVWTDSLQYSRLYDLVLHSLLAFAAMAMWIESQGDRVVELGRELDRVRRESARNLDLDHLTGLLNQAALAKRMEEAGGYSGVVAVCDMDNFKEINDRYGHLVGDEILRNVGHLLRSSIRHEDRAFRWGGDEFVILFHNQRRAVAQQRMTGIQERLRNFRVRGHGALPISFSWGTAESDNRPLRQMVDEADHDMYTLKRQRKDKGSVL